MVRMTLFPYSQMIQFIFKFKFDIEFRISNVVQFNNKIGGMI